MFGGDWITTGLVSSASDELKKKYILTRWNIICRPKDQGGLGIEVLDVKNKCLLSKWLFKLLSEEGVWQELLSNKYLHGKTLSQVHAKPIDSPFWKGLMGVKNNFFNRGSFCVGGWHRDPILGGHLAWGYFISKSIPYFV
jgi:hypothetical protein